MRRQWRPPSIQTPVAVVKGATKPGESATVRSVVWRTVQGTAAKGLLGPQYCSCSWVLVGWFGDGGCGNDDDAGVLAAGHLDEALEVGWLGRAAGDEEISFGRAVRGWLGYGYGCQRSDHPHSNNPGPKGHFLSYQFVSIPVLR